MKPAITPGEILLEDYLVPMGISQNVLARAIGINRLGISELVASQNSY
jgi:addiction module HigA family antidote